MQLQGDGVGTHDLGVVAVQEMQLLGQLQFKPNTGQLGMAHEFRYSIATDAGEYGNALPILRLEEDGLGPVRVLAPLGVVEVHVTPRATGRSFAPDCVALGNGATRTIEFERGGRLSVDLVRDRDATGIVSAWLDNISGGRAIYPVKSALDMRTAIQHMQFVALYPGTYR